MLSKLQKFVPGFLLELDRKWLLNRPLLWATRIHYVAFFGGIGAALVFLHSMIRNFPLHDIPNVEAEGLLMIIPVVLAVAFWAWSSSQYQAVKGQGMESKGSSRRNQAIYGGIVLAAMLLPAVYMLQVSERVANTISDTELAQDIKTLRAGAALVDADYADGDYQNPFQYRIYTSQVQLPEAFFDEGSRKRYRCKSARASRLQAFIQVFNKYASEPVPELNMDLLDMDHAPYSYHEAEEEVVLQINRILDAKFRSPFKRMNPWIMICLAIGLTLWIAVQSYFLADWQTLGGTVLVGGLSFAGLGLTIGLVQKVFSVYDDKIIFMLALIGYAFFVFQAFRGGISSRSLRWRQISLTLASWGTFLLPVTGYSLFVTQHFGDDEAVQLFMLGAAICIGAWNMVFRPQFVKLATQPHVR